MRTAMVQLTLRKLMLVEQWHLLKTLCRPAAANTWPSVLMTPENEQKCPYGRCLSTEIRENMIKRPRRRIERRETSGDEREEDKSSSCSKTTNQIHMADDASSRRAPARPPSTSGAGLIPFQFSHPVTSSVLYIGRGQTHKGVSDASSVCLLGLLNGGRNVRRRLTSVAEKVSSKRALLKTTLSMNTEAQTVP